MQRHVAAHGDTHQRERVRFTMAQTARMITGRTVAFIERPQTFNRRASRGRKTGFSS
jgi:hypothetical protein